MSDFVTMRRMMVDGQIRTADVTDSSIIDAFMKLPRERFLPDRVAALAYLDIDLPVGEPANGVAPRRLLKPMVLAKMVQALELQEGARVLDVGCATGYAAALLAELGCSVVALEQDPGLERQARAAVAAMDIRNVEVISGKLPEGWLPGAPYDSILIEGAVDMPPDRLCAQLRDGGRLVCIQGAGPATQATLYRRDLDDVSARPIFDAAAPVLPGFAKPAAFVF